MDDYYNLKEVKQVDPKPGVYTSEFYTMLATVILIILNSVFKWDLPREIFVPPIAYILSRGLAKLTK